MYIQVRLYSRHDYDLLAYTALPYLKLDDLIHGSVCAYVRGMTFYIPPVVEAASELKAKDKRICVTFDDVKDKDVIEWLGRIKEGRVNAVLKMITRLYLPDDVIANVFLDSGSRDIKRSGMPRFETNTSAIEDPAGKKEIPSPQGPVKKAPEPPTIAESDQTAPITASDEQNDTSSDDSSIFDMFEAMGESMMV